MFKSNLVKSLSIVLLTTVMFLSSKNTVFAAYEKALPIEDRFIWFSATNPADSEIRYVASNYSYIIFDGGYDSYNKTPQIEDLKKIKAINPNAKVFAYYLTFARYNIEKPLYGETEFATHPLWLLQGLNGKPVPVNDTNNTDLWQGGYWLDLSNPNLRGWIETLVNGWTISGFDGIAFDNVVEMNHSEWDAKIGATKVDAWNMGLHTLLNETRAKLPADKHIIYNGLHVAGGRSFITQDSVEGALDEFFCYTGGPSEVLDQQFHPRTKVLSDLSMFNTMNITNKKIVLANTLFGRLLPTSGAAQPTDAQMELTGRYCFGVFMLGYAPGYTKFKFSNSYGYKPIKPNIYQNPLEIDLPIGKPVANFSAVNSNGLYQRQFTNGYVVVNIPLDISNRSSTTNTWTAPENLLMFNGGKLGRTVNKGDTLTLNGYNADFLLKVIPSPESTNVADLTQEGNTSGDIVNKPDFDLFNLFFYRLHSPQPWGWIRKMDLNADGKVDIFDYNIFVSNFGK